VGPNAVAIATVPPPLSAPSFTTFRVSDLDIELSSGWRADKLDVRSEFTLPSADRKGFDLQLDAVKLQAGPFIGTIPAGSFTRGADGSYTYDGPVKGAVNTLNVKATIRATGTLRYSFDAKAGGLDMPGLTNPGQVALSIGGRGGLAKVKARLGRGEGAGNRRNEDHGNRHDDRIGDRQAQTNRRAGAEW
jgi:hypothetical protein